MEIMLLPLEEKHRVPVIDIFNYYIENTFAAFPENPLSYEMFDLFLSKSQGYPRVAAVDETGTVVGFGLLHPFNPFPTFAHVVEITCFLKPGYTGQQIGGRIRAHLESEAKRRGISTILAGISSLNPGSLRYHEQAGFVRRGELVGVCRKRGEEFNLVWMQKQL